MALKKLAYAFLALGIWSGIAILYFCPELMKNCEPPKLEDEWWGRGPLPKDVTSFPKDDTTIKKYTINVKDSVLKDLQGRLNNTRFVEELENVEFQYGFRSSYLKEVVEYWRTKYNWRKHEKNLNKFSHFVTQIEGIDVHFIHQKPNLRGKNLRVLPLLFVHGFPDSVHGFHKVIPLLTTPREDRDYVFEVICPSIPGFGFSEAPHHPGFSVASAARVFTKLMTRLGHKTFYLQGGDWGSMINSIIAAVYPERVSGLHLSMAVIQPGVFGCIKYVIGFFFPSLVMAPEEHVNLYPLTSYFRFLLEETGYFHIQATKPGTIGSALSDSPAGLAAYIMERFSVWTDKTYRNLPDGGLTKKFTLDELLTNLMVYWCTNNIASSQRFYKELFNQKTQTYNVYSLQVKVPTGFAAFPNEMVTYPKFLIEDKYKNLIHYSAMPRGGHFAALEEPELFSEEIWKFVNQVENLKNSGTNKS